MNGTVKLPSSVMKSIEVFDLGVGKASWSHSNEKL